MSLDFRNDKRAATENDQTAPSPWWRGGVIYECHLPSLRDGNNDGIGDLIGLTESLGYLSDTLGVDAIWTGPFYESPLLDQGFDVSNYTAVEPVFGTLEDFDNLVAEAHRRGVRIIVDYIPNHTSDQHPWFHASRSSRTDPKRDWYVWRDPVAGGGVPNNWTSEAGGSVWEFDEHTGQYYLHSHLKEQPDLNWRNPEVRAALLDVLRFWLQRGVDGIRIDVAHMLMKDPEFKDNPESPGNENVFDLQHPDFGTQLHLYDRRHPDTHDVLTQIRAVVDEFSDVVTIAEIEAMPWHDWAMYYGEQLTGMHLPFPFRLLETPWQADLLQAELIGMYESLPPDAWPIIALGNHDRKRLATRLGTAQAKVAAVLLLTLAASPCLLYGDELGLTDQEVPAERGRDYFATNIGGVSRDGTRTPMPWNSALNAGFSDAEESALWLPIAEDAERISVEAQLADPLSPLSMYRQLIGLRSASRALHHGDINIVRREPTGGALVYERRHDDDHKVIALNLTGQPVSVDLPHGGDVVFSTHPAARGQTVSPAIELAADEAVVIDIKGAPRA